MKVTKRQLKLIIREVISGASVRTQEPFMDIVIASLQDGRTWAAATAIMNSFEIDDTSLEDEEALFDILDGLPHGASVEQIEMAADTWLENYRARNLRP